ncbi:MAG: polyprenyl synthetase family protein, partial [Verrucomicrobiales bacterium]|nr:polyprenyl synthetase family protein [Verrucomicrobiales bacterium]
VKGKLTLPMLYLLMNATEAQKTKLSRMLLQGEPMDTSILAGIADYEGALDRAVSHGQTLIREAQAQLLVLPASPYRDALEGTGRYLHNLLDKCRVLA